MTVIDLGNQVQLQSKKTPNARTLPTGEERNQTYLRSSLRIFRQTRRAAMQVTTILVEDNQTIRNTLVPALEEITKVRVVRMAATAKEAKEALVILQGQWQLIIVDLFLTAGSGLEVLEAVKERSSEQYAFVLSNYVTADMSRRCLELGADEVFDKSTELDAFF
jgi:CheY-like chemotaxis protein